MAKAEEDQMKVYIKDFQLPLELGNKGITIDIYDASGKKHLGDLRVGKATIEWCKGRTRSGNGVQRGWSDLIDWFEKK